jgi:hypothetical protein
MSDEPKKRAFAFWLGMSAFAALAVVFVKWLRGH